MKFFLIFFITGIISFGCGNRNDEDLFSLEDKGDQAFARREYMEAANIWKKVYLEKPKQILLINKLGDCYLKLGRLERAKFFFQQAVKINPDNIGVQIKLAQIYILIWNLPEAVKICERFENQKLNHPELDLIRADISIMSNQTDRAEKFYRKAVISSKGSLRALMKLAIFLKSVNNDEEASEVLDNVKRNTIVSPQIYLLMADYYLLGELYDKAEQSILDAIKIEPEDMILKYHLVQFYMAIESNSKAETLLENMLYRQDDIYLRMMLSDVYIVNKKFKKAEEIILKLKEEINGPTIGFELLQGKFWLYSGRPIFATSHLKSALDLNPGLVNARYLLGLTHLINGKIKLSENSLLQTLEIYPHHYKALLLMSELQYKKREYNLSLTYLEHLLVKYPGDFTGHIIKGLNLLGQNKYLSAKKEFKKSIHMSSDVYISYYYLGLTEELLNNDIKALQYYKQVLEIYPDLIDVSYRYCLLLLKMKKHKIADDFIKEKLTKSKKSPEVYFLAAKVAQKIGHPSKGEAFLKKAIQLDDAPGFIYMELARSYRHDNKFKESIKILKQCTLKNPYFEDAWLELCKQYIDLQNLTTALEIIEEGYKKFKDSPIFQSNLAWLLLEDNQQTNRALCLAQSAYEKMPENIAICDTLGWAYYHKGIYSQAIWLLSDVEKKAPDNGFIQYHLGMTYYQQGKIEKAVHHLKAAQKSDALKYFSREIDQTFSELATASQKESKTQIPDDNSSILSPPENGIIDDNIIIPQWKQ